MNLSNIDYNKKYFKYKIKYNSLLKDIYGGSNSNFVTTDVITTKFNDIFDILQIEYNENEKKIIYEFINKIKLTSDDYNKMMRQIDEEINKLEEYNNILYNLQKNNSQFFDEGKLNNTMNEIGKLEGIILLKMFQTISSNGDITTNCKNITSGILSAIKNKISAVNNLLKDNLLEDNKNVTTTNSISPTNIVATNFVNDITNSAYTNIVSPKEKEELTSSADGSNVITQTKKLFPNAKIKSRTPLTPINPNIKFTSNSSPLTKSKSFNYNSKKQSARKLLTAKSSINLTSHTPYQNKSDIFVLNNEEEKIQQKNRLTRPKNIKRLTPANTNNNDNDNDWTVPLDSLSNKNTLQPISSHVDNNGTNIFNNSQLSNSALNLQKTENQNIEEKNKAAKPLPALKVRALPQNEEPAPVKTNNNDDDNNFLYDMKKRRIPELEYLKETNYNNDPEINKKIKELEKDISEEFEQYNSQNNTNFSIEDIYKIK